LMFFSSTRVTESLDVRPTRITSRILRLAPFLPGRPAPFASCR
jgi:hypothetical protein